MFIPEFIPELILRFISQACIRVEPEEPGSQQSLLYTDCLQYATMRGTGCRITVVAVSVVRSILGYLAKKEATMPIQVERDLKISRYLVFGSMIIMEELGLVKPIAKRANWKLYRITEKGRELLEKGKTVIELEANDRGS